ncbi:MAG: polysaccharide deacetylase family protein [Gammaproteobacteria bacterium]|nr:polysaccharide deacetylase family protein [Gammaproteobacteria bacterium]
MKLPARTLVSIHDVMPETLDEVEEILQRLADAGTPGTVTLLVVPGRNWSADDIAVLRRWADAGHELAGHGWAHEVETIRGVWHRLHSLFISRNVAEHLALDEQGIRTIIEECHAWFVQTGLPAPMMYVPPAWAMGRVGKSALRALPFRYYETLSGIYDATTGTMTRIPLVGFEADTPLRAGLLRLFNAVNRWLANRRGQLRLAIHPQDFDLLLADDLERMTGAVGM